MWTPRFLVFPLQTEPGGAAGLRCVLASGRIPGRGWDAVCLCPGVLKCPRGCDVAGRELSGAQRCALIPPCSYGLLWRSHLLSKLVRPGLSSAPRLWPRATCATSHLCSRCGLSQARAVTQHTRLPSVTPPVWHWVLSSAEPGPGRVPGWGGSGCKPSPCSGFLGSTPPPPSIGLGNSSLSLGPDGCLVLASVGLF